MTDSSEYDLDKAREAVDPEDVAKFAKDLRWTGEPLVYPNSLARRVARAIGIKVHNVKDERGA